MRFGQLQETAWVRVESEVLCRRVRPEAVHGAWAAFLRIDGLLDGRVAHRRLASTVVTPRPSSVPAVIVVSDVSLPPETASRCIFLHRNHPANCGEFQAETSSRLIRTSVT